MSSSGAAVRHLVRDPLWMCLCPLWPTSILAARPRARLTLPSVRQIQPRRQRSSSVRRRNKLKVQFVPSEGKQFQAEKKLRISDLHDHEANLTEETPILYTRLRVLALEGKFEESRQLAEYLVRDRGEKPNTSLYNALILSNVSHKQGAAWRVSDYLEEMRKQGLTPDVSTCHAVLKVLSVHPDHLLRTDTLAFMKTRWYELSAEGNHDVVAGVLREGLYEQALEKMDGMRKDGIQIQPWLLDLTVYMLCANGEIDEACRIMRGRLDSGDLNISRSVWHELLDSASDNRHVEASSLVWYNHVQPGYMNPSSGICLNVLSTAARAGDANLATDVFSHLSNRGTTFNTTHYAELITCYLSASTPDLHRAMAVLTIMALEKKPPTSAETRDLFLYLRNKPESVKEAFSHLRSLHEQGRTIPIAALNLLIECHVEQSNLDEAMKVYKLIHTFAPLPEQGTAPTRKSFTNVETYNLLIRGCRRCTPPDAPLATFLMSEMQALRVRPARLTYDRLILVCTMAAVHALEDPKATETQGLNEDTEMEETSEMDTPHETETAPEPTSASLTDAESIANEMPNTAAPTQVEREANAQKFLDRAILHFFEVQEQGWMPRFGTVELLAVQLAKLRDERCWDVLQAGEDNAEEVEGWASKGRWAKKNVEKAWDESTEKAAHVE